MKEKENRFGEKIEKNIRYNKKTDTYFVQFTFKDISELKGFSTLEDARKYRDAINFAKTEAKIKHDLLVIHDRESEEMKKYLDRTILYPDNVLEAIKIKPGDYRVPENFEVVFRNCNERETNFVKLFYRDRLTLEEIGIANGRITRERVRQIIAKALKAVKNYILSYESREKIRIQEQDLADRHAMREKLIEAYRETGVITKEMEFEFGKLYISPEEMSVYELGIDELDLSVRSYNCLCKAKILSVGELVKLTKQEVLEIKHLGKKSCNEIEKKLKLFGLTFAGVEE